MSKYTQSLYKLHKFEFETDSLGVKVEAGVSSRSNKHWSNQRRVITLMSIQELPNSSMRIF